MALGSFSAALSGLRASNMYLGVIGNNLANINTVGFKASAVQFADLVSQSVGGSSSNPMQIGLGVGVGSISPSFTQGAIESSQLATNVAIQGGGFFVISNATGIGYTRAGNFTLDNSGALVTPDGSKVQGWSTVDPVTNLVNTSGVPGNIVIPPGALRAPTATTSFKTMTNLNATAAVGATFSTAVTTYDALGASHVLTVTYTKTGANAWSTQMTVPGAEVVGGTAGTPFVLASGTLALAFNATGQLTTINAAPPTDRTITTPAYTNGASASTWNWDVMEGTTAALTQYSTESSTSSITQSGNGAGRVDDITIGTDGRILASFGASGAVAIGQIAIANFNNPEGLSKAGSNRYSATDASGVPNIGVAGTGGRGELIGNALEQSNVDVAEEFTRMILAQRGYQANAKTITVADELMVETMNLKR
jgi:flagellar hook protein FlgE